MSENLKTKNVIKEAAVRLFSTYGFSKTTMAEIGKECDMSAANLYRFYKNKQDIAAAIAEDHFEADQLTFREVARRSDLSPSEKIRLFATTAIDLTAELLEAHKTMEMIDYVCREQDDLVKCHCDQKQSILAEILAEGNRTGEFDVADIVKTAGAVLKAFIYFEYPAFAVHCSKEEMRAEADEVVDLVLSGLAKR